MRRWLYLAEAVAPAAATEVMTPSETVFVSPTYIHHFQYQAMAFVETNIIAPTTPSANTATARRLPTRYPTNRPVIQYDSCVDPLLDLAPETINVNKWLPQMQLPVRRANLSYLIASSPQPLQDLPSISEAQVPNQQFWTPTTIVHFQYPAKMEPLLDLTVPAVPPVSSFQPMDMRPTFLHRMVYPFSTEASQEDVTLEKFQPRIDQNPLPRPPNRAVYHWNQPVFEPSLISVAAVPPLDTWDFKGPMLLNRSRRLEHTWRYGVHEIHPGVLPPTEVVTLNQWFTGLSQPVRRPRDDMIRYPTYAYALGAPVISQTHTFVQNVEDVWRIPRGGKTWTIPKGGKTWTIPGGEGS